VSLVVAVEKEGLSSWNPFFSLPPFVKKGRGEGVKKGGSASAFALLRGRQRGSKGKGGGGKKASITPFTPHFMNEAKSTDRERGLNSSLCAGGRAGGGGKGRKRKKKGKKGGKSETLDLTLHPIQGERVSKTRGRKGRVTFFLK